MARNSCNDRHWRLDLSETTYFEFQSEEAISAMHGWEALHLLGCSSWMDSCLLLEAQLLVCSCFLAASVDTSTTTLDNNTC